MRAQKRGKKGEVHVYQPAGSATFWVRYTVNGERKRQNTGKATEAEARIFAAQVGRMVGLATSVRIPVKVATHSTGKLPPKPVKAATPSERSDAGGLFLLYLVSCRQICLLFSE